LSLPSDALWGWRFHYSSYRQMLWNTRSPVILISEDLGRQCRAHWLRASTSHIHSVSKFLLCRADRNIPSPFYVDVLCKRLVCGLPGTAVFPRGFSSASFFAMESSQLVRCRNSKEQDLEDLVGLVAPAESRSCVAPPFGWPQFPCVLFGSNDTTI